MSESADGRTRITHVGSAGGDVIVLLGDGGSVGGLRMTADQADAYVARFALAVAEARAFVPPAQPPPAPISSDVRVLAALRAASGPMLAGDLARTAGLDQATTDDAVMRLCRRGRAVRTGYRVALTAKGRGS